MLVKSFLVPQVVHFSFSVDFCGNSELLIKAVIWIVFRLASRLAERLPRG
jgi:hypothetical protein